MKVNRPSDGPRVRVTRCPECTSYEIDSSLAGVSFFYYSFLPLYLPEYPKSRVPSIYFVSHPIPRRDSDLGKFTLNAADFNLEKCTFYNGIGWKLLNKTPPLIRVKVEMQCIDRSNENDPKYN